MNRGSSLDLDSYQRAARTILTHHLVTAGHPDRVAFPLVRRWATELRDDLAELFGYRLEITETTARLFTVRDEVGAGVPARTATDRVFDRRRYAYLALCLAVLGRAGGQIVLGELARRVSSEAGRVQGLELDTARAAHRDAFVDAVGWLTDRGALTLADGDAAGWAADPDTGEALYDVDRSVVVAVFRPPRLLDRFDGVHTFLARGDVRTARDDSTARTRRVRRALVERPVVHADELDDADRLVLAKPATADAVRALTGLVPERRREGVAMIDPTARFTDVRFPATGTVAQVALLLAGEIAERVLGADDMPRRPMPTASGPALACALDAALPGGAHPAPTEPVAGVETHDDPGHPFVDDAWLAETVERIADRYGTTFASRWQADGPGLRREALALLDRLSLVRFTHDGVVALPALARYRGVVVDVRTLADAELPLEDPPPGNEEATSETPAAHAPDTQQVGTA
ncbi:TIGR02678 family protein [Rhodococcus sp. HNM0569]|uniref:TIGR02678 family protein n=1 Tax=Rhodococcus sp. HNM0569 TaxID=2716340 RepID=UPI00146A97C6|nr:TIGR02678 family protein [Rhodococcus sp. HNM0569]NLU84920.1 TIGR02678 family protein [Rhodococcus sp. HNM0569]